MRQLAGNLSRAWAHECESEAVPSVTQTRRFLVTRRDMLQPALNTQHNTDENGSEEEEKHSKISLRILCEWRKAEARLQPSSFVNVSRSPETRQQQQTTHTQQTRKGEETRRFLVISSRPCAPRRGSKAVQVE